MRSCKRVCLYFPKDLLDEVFGEARRLDRANNWIVTQCIRYALKREYDEVRSPRRTAHRRYTRSRRHASAVSTRNKNIWRDSAEKLLADLRKVAK